MMPKMRFAAQAKVTKSRKSSPITAPRWHGKCDIKRCQPLVPTPSTARSGQTPLWARHLKGGLTGGFLTSQAFPQFTYKAVNVSGATSTQVRGINSAGEMVGFYRTTSLF